MPKPAAAKTAVPDVSVADREFRADFGRDPQRPVSVEDPGAMSPSSSGVTATTGAKPVTAANGVTSPTARTTGLALAKPQMAPSGVQAQSPSTANAPVAATGAVNHATKPAPAEAPSKLEIKDYKIKESKAYTLHLKPLLGKIRGLNPATAERLEKRLLDLKLRTYNTTDAEVWEHFRAETLVDGFKLPERTEFRLIQLKDSVLIPASEMDEDEAAARWLLEAALFRLAFDSAEKKDMNFMSTVTGLSHAISDRFLKSRDRLNRRLVYEYLRHAQVPVDEWKFEQLDTIGAASAILRLAPRQYRVAMAQPAEAFDVKPLDSNDPRAENCDVHISYQGVEKGVRVQITEPQWREFEINFDVQSQGRFPLRPSLAGDDLLDLEILQKQADKSSLRLTVRYKAQAAGTDEERIADHVVFEKLPEKGKAEKILMCRIIPWADVPAQAREEAPAAATGETTATAGAAAATGNTGPTPKAEATSSTEAKAEATAEAKAGTAAGVGSAGTKTRK